MPVNSSQELAAEAMRVETKLTETLRSWRFQEHRTSAEERRKQQTEPLHDRERP